MFRERYRAVQRFVYQRVSDRELAEDIAAEVFQIAWKHFCAEGAVSMAWLVATSRNLIGTEHQRRSRSRAHIGYLLDEELEHFGAVDGAYEDLELRLAMARLRREDALALQLTYWDGLSASEAALLLECSVPAFWARLSRARRALKALLVEGCDARPEGQQYGE